jgi:hypothetical protein
VLVGIVPAAALCVLGAALTLLSLALGIATALVGWVGGAALGLARWAIGAAPAASAEPGEAAIDDTPAG